MPPMGQLILKHMGLLGIFTAFANAGIYWWGARAKIAEHPECADELRNIIWGSIILLSIPWIPMGAGIVFGGLPSWDYFLNPKDLNPFVLAFHAIAIADLIFILVWMFFKGGAELMVKHQDIFLRHLFRPTPSYTVLQFKLLMALGLLVAFASFVYEWVEAFPCLTP
jgi:hypothetical protein